MINPDAIDNLKKIVGKERCFDAPEQLACYCYDAYFEEAMPDLVLFPCTRDEVSGILKICAAQKIPVTARGAGTSVCGASIPARGGVVLCFSKMNRIIEINTKDRYVIVEPGVINADLQKALAPFGFFYPPDPGSMAVSTIGGNVAQNAGGPRCLKYGVTVDYVLGMEVVLASGKVVRFGSRNVKDVTGYRLSSLFCGSEGTLGMVTSVILKVLPKPESVSTLLVTFDDLDHTANAVADIIGAGILPVALELMDKTTIRTVEDNAHIGLPVDAEGTLLIEVDGVKEACEKEIKKIAEKLEANGAVSIDIAKTEEEREKLWVARRSVYGVFAKLSASLYTEDIVVPAGKIPEMTRKIVEIAEKYNLLVGVMAHAGDGNMHPMIPGNKANKEEWGRVKKAFDEIMAAAASLNGSLSGEHGIGLAKTEYLPLVMDDDTVEFMGVIKKAVDPDGILNPGKFV
nr:FAD-linked oxidase C-terminal domain-containing protein [uncultured Desulfobacter sp.]